MEKKIRVMVAKVGCDIHERGALTMMSIYRDAGIEVIYTGRYQTEVAVANAAITEDVDMIIVSDLGGNLPLICRKILAELKAHDAEIPLLCGGLMTEKDQEIMAEMGVRACFPTGCSTDVCLQTVFEVAAE